jgi:methylenetetrahydrofolate reductase (NADPH)
MNAFGYRPDTKIIDVLRRGRFTLSAEVIPPRNGTEMGAVLQQIRELVGSGAEFLSVTKGAGGSLRGGSLPIAQSIKEQLNVPCIAHFTCRDLNPQEIENQLIDHHYFGIRNILALRGDPPTDQPNWSPKADSYPYAFQLIEQIRAMNGGRFLARTGDASHDDLLSKTEFSIGAAVYPEHPDERERYDFFARKIEAGAQYAITQMLFDPEAYARFLDGCDRRSIRVPILPGFRVLRSQTQAVKMAKRFGVSIPSKLLSQLPEALGPDAAADSERALIAFEGLLREFRRLGAPGVHVFVLSDTRGSCSLIERARR